MVQKVEHVCRQVAEVVVKMVLNGFALEFVWNMITVEKSALFHSFTVKTAQEKKSQFFLSILFIRRRFLAYFPLLNEVGAGEYNAISTLSVISLLRVLNFQWYLINIGAVAILGTVYSFIIHLNFNWIENVYRWIQPNQTDKFRKMLLLLFPLRCVCYFRFLFICFIVCFVLFAFNVFIFFCVLFCRCCCSAAQRGWTVFISVFIFSMDHLAKTWFIQWFDCCLLPVFVTLLSMKNSSEKKTA